MRRSPAPEYEWAAAHGLGAERRGRRRRLPVGPAVAASVAVVLVGGSLALAGPVREARTVTARCAKKTAGCATFVNRGKGVAATFRTKGEVPFRVAKPGMVPRLNADTLDGRQADDLDDTPPELLAKLGGVDGRDSGLDADTVDGAGADDFVGARRILFGRAPAASDQALVVSWPAMGLEVRTHDVDAGDAGGEVRVVNVNPPGGARLWVGSNATAQYVDPGGSYKLGAVGGRSIVVTESGGPGRIVQLACAANVNYAEDDHYVVCSGITAGAGA